MTLFHKVSTVWLITALITACGSSGRITDELRPEPTPPVSLPPAPQNTALVIAHRGASAYAPEHTFAAWDLARAMGADYLEQDIQQTLDGVLVVLHDDTLDRTARGPAENCSGPVRSKTLAQLRTCEVGSWFNERFPERARPEYVNERIPTLEEVFQRYGREVRYYIETKSPETTDLMMEQRLVALMDAYGLREPAIREQQVLIQSFSPASLLRLQAIDPALPLIQLFAAGAGLALEFAATYAVGIGPSAGQVDAALVQRAQALGLMVHPYTVNNPETQAALLALCVDGMFTDVPVVRSAQRALAAVCP
jgi:glycerophosphoryl diester phosphodiesterase